MMNFSNTKYLISMLKKSKVTGKYSSGNSNKSDCISQECVITKHSKGKIAIYNANNHSYIRLLVAVNDVELNNSFAIDVDMLIKYLTNYKNEITLKIKDNTLIGYDEEKQFTMPLLNRHEYNDTIFHFMSVFTGLPFNASENKEGLTINENTTLKSFIKIDADILKDAFDCCESVGSSIYTLSWDNPSLYITSNKGTEKMLVNIDPIIEESFGEPFEVTISSPINSLLSNYMGIVNIYGNTDQPLFLNASNRIHYLIAPRVEE